MPLPTADTPSGWNALLADDARLADGVREIRERHRLTGLQAIRYPDGSLPVYALGTTHVLKLYPPHEGAYAEVEWRVLSAVGGALPIPTPLPLASGRVDGWHYVLMSQLHGRRLVDVWPALSRADRDDLADELGTGVAALHALDAAALADLPPAWPAFMREQRARAVERQAARRLDARWLDQLPAFLDAWAPPIEAPRSLLHTELMREHLLVSAAGGRWHVSGLYDFEPSMLGAPEYEFASFGLFVACGDGRFLRRTLLAYGCRAAELDAALQCRLMAYAILHRYSHLPWYLQRLPPNREATLEQLAARWWPLEDD